MMDRRQFLQTAAAATALSATPMIQAADDSAATIDAMAKRAFDWFTTYRPATGLVLDRGPNKRGVEKKPNLCSIASIGYYLSALPGAVKLGWIDADTAKKQTKETLSFIWEKLPHHRGLFYHFYDATKGTTNSEISALDTALFLNGVVVAGQYYGDEIGKLADQLLDRTDWTALEMVNKGNGKESLSMAFFQKNGKTELAGPMDLRSSEYAMPYFLAVGSRTHSIDPQRWYNTGFLKMKLSGREVCFGNQPIFLSYYSLAWHRLAGMVDRTGFDMDDTAKQVCLINREYCRSIAKDHPTYNEENGWWWGLSAGDSPAGYVAAAPGRMKSLGTVWPVTAIAGLPWIPQELNEDVARWKKSPMWDKVNLDFGLAPFNVEKDPVWIARDLIGIDLGSFLLNWMNVKTGIVQDLWMSHPIAKNAMERLEYRKK